MRIRNGYIARAQHQLPTLDIAAMLAHCLHHTVLLILHAAHPVRPSRSHDKMPAPSFDLSVKVILLVNVELPGIRDRATLAVAETFVAVYLGVRPWKQSLDALGSIEAIWSLLGRIGGRCRSEAVDKRAEHGFGVGLAHNDEGQGTFSGQASPAVKKVTPNSRETHVSSPKRLQHAEIGKASEFVRLCPANIVSCVVSLSSDIVLKADISC